MKLIFLSLTVFVLNSYSSEAYLRVQNKELYYNNEKVFLSGVNIAWFNYARDFGSGAYNGVKSKYEQAINEISANGGNVIRVWLHIDGQWSPKFNNDGYATGADTQSLVAELGQMLDHAHQKNVMVILCLWNLAVKPTQHNINLYFDESKLNQYFDKVLRPMVSGLKNKPALGAWEVINEPMGSILPGEKGSDPCTDTNLLVNSGANWSGANLHMKDVLRFINHHADVIKSADPKALVTVGDSAVVESTIESNNRNYYSDHCLTSVGGKAKGTIDFYQFHSYTWQGKFATNSPFKHRASDYKLDKPVIVGEFATSCSESKDAINNYKNLYQSGYHGALSWQYNEGGDCADHKDVMNKGMNAIKDMTNNGKIRIHL